MGKSKHGFSLVEMAIVLIIFGLVLASASSILTLFVNKGGAERTRKMIEADKNALFSIAASDGYFINPGDTSRDSTAELMGMMSYPNDAYNVGFHLITAPELDIDADKTDLDYSPVCGASGTSYRINLCDDTACSDFKTVSNVAFALVSGSVNKNIQTDVSGNVVTVHYQGTDAVDDYTGDLGGARAEKYDDIVDWVTLPELRVKAGCGPQRLDFMDISMPEMKEGEKYGISVFAKDGVPYVSDSAPDTELYDYTLEGINDDDGNLLEDLSGFQVSISVMPGYLPLSTGTVSTETQRGSYIRFSSNGSPVAGLSDSSYYRVIIKIGDESSPQDPVTRTLYIRKMVN